jgi:hypothetical protein
MMLRLPGIPYLLYVNKPSGTLRVRELGPLRTFWQQHVLPPIPIARQQPLRGFARGPSIAVLSRILPDA